MTNKPAKYEVLIKQYLRSILDISAADMDAHFQGERYEMVAVPEKQAQSERLPPTQAALKEAILRAHYMYQRIVWSNGEVPNPELPSQQTYGWMMDKGIFCIRISCLT